VKFSQSETQGDRGGEAFSSDMEIAILLGQGCDKTAENFVRQHSPWMLAVARRILGNDASAQDSVQEAFADAFTNIGRFEGRSTLKTWLHRIVVNRCLMVLRSAKRKAEEQLDELMPQFDGHNCRIEEPWPQLLPADEICEQKQLSTMVRGMIDKLPESFRIVLLLRDIEGYSTKEVASQLELSESNVKVRLHRARAALKHLLEPVLRGHMS